MRIRSWRKVPAKVAAALRSISRVRHATKARDGLFPFVLPWDDSSPGPTNLSAWNRPIEGEADRLRRGPDGHLYRGTERVRLFGFNIASGAAFPDRRIGQRVAARLARLGVNYLRIAQCSNPAPDGWLDPATAASLDPEALDRLDGFIARLRRRGIYVHLVLNHFRRFYPAHIPGFETDRWLPAGWPPLGTGVIQFFTPLIEHNRAVARQLLMHRNRETGLTYAEDPAIAVVEVSNEDGLVVSWRGGALDHIVAARALHLRPIRDELQARWNSWLRARYENDDTVRVAWAPGATAAGGQLLVNGDFRQGDTCWRVETPAGARAQHRVLQDGGPAGRTPSLEVHLDRTGTEGAHVTVAQDGLHLDEGQPYRITLWARAARAGAKVSVDLRHAGPLDRRLIAPAGAWTLTSDWKRHIGRFTPSATDANARLTVTVGREAGTVWVADVAMREDPVIGLRPDESPARGTVPPLSRAGLSPRTQQTQRDWIAFLSDTENRFFADSIRFLRDDLGVRSLVVGTQADFGPSAQTGSDITSLHGYWAHPSFPARPWDPDDWYVPNRSMVNARDEWHTLNRIAFQRRRDKPLVVDEYNHPQPNSFGAEGFPLAAAYGAFQDWDGLAGWAYREAWEKRWLSRADWARPMIRNYFALDTDPVRLLSAWLAAVMFRRGDVAPGAQLVSVGTGAEFQDEIGRTVGFARTDAVMGKGAERVPLRHRVALDPGTILDIRDQPPSGATPIVSDTGELTWDAHPTGGVVTVNTPLTRAVIGFGGNKEFQFGALAMRPGPTAQKGFGVWAITALDGSRPIETARRMVVIALGYSQNTDQEWKILPERAVPAGPPRHGAVVTLGSSWGRPPALVEGVPARIAFAAGTRGVRVWALDERGRRRKEVPVSRDTGWAIAEIEARYRTLWYEVAVSERAL